MPQKKLINPPSPRAGKTPFAQGVQVGETLYVSGQIAQDKTARLSVSAIWWPRRIRFSLISSGA